MKKVVLLLFLLTPILHSNADKKITKKVSVIEKLSNWEILIKSIIQVESRGDRLAIGKTNDVGILQITPVYVKEVNRIIGEEKFTLECRKSIEKSIEMFEIYQNYYNPKKDINKAIKLHNPGAGIWYKKKVLNYYKIITELNEKI